MVIVIVVVPVVPSPNTLIVWIPPLLALGVESAFKLWVSVRAPVLAPDALTDPGPVTTATVVVEPVVAIPVPAALATKGVTLIVAICVVPAANLRVFSEPSAEPVLTEVPAMISECDLESGAEGASTTTVHVTAEATGAVVDRPASVNVAVCTYGVKVNTYVPIRSGVNARV
jgi:hypothetical protein